MFTKLTPLSVVRKGRYFTLLFGVLLCLILSSFSLPGNEEIPVAPFALINPPVFTSANVSTFQENGTGTVLDVNANDGDGGATDTSVTYSLGGADGASFNITASGILTFISSPNYHEPEDTNSDNVYQITITADNGTAQDNTSTQEVKIAVLPIANEDFGTSSELVNFLGRVTVSSEWLGAAVATSGNGRTMAMGALQADGPEFLSTAGYTKVVEWKNDGWKQKGDLIFGTIRTQRSGQSLSIDYSGNVIAVGSLSYTNNVTRSGGVRVYFWNGIEWTQRGEDIQGTSEDGQFGYSVSLSADGSVLAVGGNFHDHEGIDKTGQVRIYHWDGEGWTQMGETFVGNAGDEMGRSVDLDPLGQIVAIGAANFNDQNNGYVKVLQWNGEGWVQLGEDIDGDDVDDLLGYSLSLNGDGKTLIVGAPYSDTPVRRTGYVRVYTWDGSSWNLKGNTIKANDFTAGLFGYSVDISGDGDVVAIGAEEYGEFDEGRALIYKWTGTAWSKVFDKVGNSSDRSFGYDLSLSADARILAVGVPFSDKNGNDAGEVRSFVLTSSTPTDFTLSSTSFLAEQAGTIVGTFNITGPVAGIKATYSFVAGNGDVDNSGFSINEGVLTTKIGHGTKNELTIRVKLTTGSGETLEKQFTLLPISLDETAPVFTSDEAISVSESVSGVFYTASATDASVINYSLGSSADEAFFNIDGVTGEISFKTSPDFDSPQDGDANNTYILIVKATDAAGNEASLELGVSVTQLDEIAPVITSPEVVEFPENGTGVAYTITAEDANPVTFGYTTQLASSLFDLDTNSGELTFKVTPDFENPQGSFSENEYYIEVTANDGSRSALKTITIKVTDVNDNAPIITSNGGGATASIEVVENSTEITKVTATDADALTPYFNFIAPSGADEALFEMDLTSGVLSWKNGAPDFDNPLDQDQDNVYEVTVLAIDGPQATEGTIATEQSLFITVVDADEVAPVFTSDEAISVSESVSGVFYTASATDAGVIIYGLGASADEAFFNIDGVTGKISFKTSPDFDSPQDADANNTYILIVKATDAAGNEATLELTVTVTQLDEIAPVITSPEVVEFPENGTGVAYTITAEDENPVTFGYTTQLASSLFDLDTNSGELTFKVTPDFENPQGSFSENEYYIEVTANDGSRSALKTITIKVTDVNDNAPIITSNGGGATASIEVVENSTEITKVTATDADALTPYFNFIAPSGADEALFEMDLTSGVLSWKNGAPDFDNPLDQDQDNVYEVTVLAIDGPQAEEGTLTATQTLNIIVIDLNEAPVSITLNNEVIDENTTSGTLVADIAISDPDAGDIHMLSLVAGEGDTDNDSFDIIDNVLVISESADFETKNNYEVRLKATDSGDLSIEQNFTVSVIDVNEVPLSITLSNQSINENEDSGITVGSLTVSDSDAGDTHVLSLAAGEGDTDNSSFNIIDNALVISESADFETKSSYQVRLKAIDSGDLSLEQAFTISITDINETPLSLTLSNLVVNENEASGTVIGSPIVSDPDAGDAHTLSLIDGEGDTDNTSFNIIDNALMISESADFETKNSYEIRLKVTDSGDLSIEQSLTISIIDVNEIPLSITLSNQSINENEDAGVSIGNLTVSDSDAGDTHVLGLASGEGDTDNGSFDIIDNALVISESADFETKSSYEVRLKATDLGDLSLEETFTISIMDVNDAPGSLSLSSQSIAENESAGTVVGDLSTADQDEGDTHSYSLVSGSGSDDNPSFDIIDNQLVSNSVLDFELKASYTVRIKTEDGEGLSLEKSFIISVADKAEPILRLSIAPTVPETGKGETSEFEITIFNDGGADLVVSEITYPEAFNGAAGDITVAPSSSQVIVMTFSPTEAVVYQGNIEFVTNAGTQSVQVSGEGAIISSIDDGLFAGSTITIYPNPADKLLTIDLSELAGNLPLDIEIVNSLGIEQFEIVAYREKLLQVDVSRYKSGLYLVRFTDGRSSAIKKVMIKR